MKFLAISLERSQIVTNLFTHQTRQNMNRIPRVAKRDDMNCIFRCGTQMDIQLSVITDQANHFEESTNKKQSSSTV